MKRSEKILRGGAIALLVLACSACSKEDAPSSTDASEPAAVEEETAAGPKLETLEAVVPEPEMLAQGVPPAAAINNAEVPPPAMAPTADAASTAAQVGTRQHIINGVVTQWSPMVLFVQPGDQIVFRQMIGHDTASRDGMIPDGAVPWQSKLGHEGFAITLEVPGVYIYVCNPHISLGMIGAIVVGDLPPHNLPVIEAHPQNKGMIGRAIRKLKEALVAAEAK